MRRLLLASSIALLGNAYAVEPKVTGIFSSMNLGAEDVTGVEVFIVYSNSGYYAHVQCAEGAISRPIVVPVNVSGNRIEFNVPKSVSSNEFSCPAGRFTGRIIKDTLEGHFAGTDWPHALNRRRIY